MKKKQRYLFSIDRVEIRKQNEHKGEGRSLQDCYIQKITPAHDACRESLRMYFLIGPISVALPQTQASSPD